METINKLYNIQDKVQYIFPYWNACSILRSMSLLQRKLASSRRSSERQGVKEISV